MSRIYTGKQGLVFFLLSVFVLSAPVFFAQGNAVGADKTGENEIALEDGRNKYTMFDNGVIEDLGDFTITISGRKFLFQGDTKGFSWDGEEKAIETFAVGYFVAFGYTPETMQLTELRMEEEFPDGGENSPQQTMQETSKTLKFENGVYTN